MTEKTKHKRAKEPGRWHCQINLSRGGHDTCHVNATGKVDASDRAIRDAIERGTLSVECEQDPLF